MAHGSNVTPIKRPRIIGIDPGASGGWSLINHQGKLEYAGTFPTKAIKRNGKTTMHVDGEMLFQALFMVEPTHAFIEIVGSRPRQAGQFQFGVNTGVVYGVLGAMGVQIERVAPQSWKSCFGIKREQDETKRDKKNEARIMVQRLFPQQKELFARVKDDGIAEATLIALYGLSLMQGGETNGH